MGVGDVEEPLCAWEEMPDRVWAVIGLLDSVVEECAVIVAEGKGSSGGGGVCGRGVGTEGGRALGG